MTTIRFTLTVGRLVVRKVERELQRVAFEQGFSVSIVRSMGWLDGELFVSVTGPAELTQRYVDSVKLWVDKAGR